MLESKSARAHSDDSAHGIGSLKIRRIFVGTLAAIVLCVSSMAAACDLSCGFSVFRSDCHSPRSATTQSDSLDMTMAGMTMPEPAADRPAKQPMVSSAPQRVPAHAALVEMGACGRQSCDPAQVLSSGTNHWSALQFEKNLPSAAVSSPDLPYIVFRDARDDIPPPDRAVYLLLDVSLRI